MGDDGVLTEARFWEQVLVDGHRTVYCPPEWESRCKGYVAARDVSDMITVVGHPYVPDNQLLIVDDNALEASRRQRAQQFLATASAFLDTQQMWESTQQRLVDASQALLTPEEFERIKEGLLRMASEVEPVTPVTDQGSED